MDFYLGFLTTFFTFVEVITIVDSPLSCVSQKIAERATAAFIDASTRKVNVEAIVVAGSGTLKNEVLRQERDGIDGRIREKIAKVVDVAYGGENGFAEVRCSCSDWR